MEWREPTARPRALAVNTNITIAPEAWISSRDRARKASVVAARMTAPDRATSKVPPPTIVRHAANNLVTMRTTATLGSANLSKRLNRADLVISTVASNAPPGAKSSDRLSNSREEIALPTEPTLRTRESASNGDARRGVFNTWAQHAWANQVEFGYELY
jgi:hypothetical protein